MPPLPTPSPAAGAADLLLPATLPIATPPTGAAQAASATPTPASGTNATPTSTAQPATTAPTPPSLPDARANLQTAIATLRQASVIKQDGIAQVMANAMQVLGKDVVPAPVQAAVQQMLALHLPTDKRPSPSDIKTALANSGLFTESTLAKTGQPPLDLKTALGRLSQAAEDWATQSANEAPIEENSAASGQGSSVPPPQRGNAPVAQKAASPTVPENASPHVMAKLLAQESQAALARQDLLQLASLPETQKSSEPRYIVDIPLMTPQGPAVAQLAIERDSHGTSAETPTPVWRVGLAINIEPLGPVRVNLALSGDHTWITIAADRPEALAQLRDQAGWLNEALTQSDLEADIAFQSSKPSATSPLDAYKKTAS